MKNSAMNGNIIIGRLDKIIAVLSHYKIAILSGVFSFAVCFFLIAAFFFRSYAIGTLKNSLEELEKNLQSVGYDYAYDDLRFYTFSPWQIMRAKNFRIYSLDEKDFWQWSIDEFNINVGLWNIENVRLFLGAQQSIQKGDKAWDVSIEDSDISMRLKSGEIKEILLAVKNIDVKNLLKVENIQTQIKHQRSPYLFIKTDIKGVQFGNMSGWPLNKHLDHFYLHASLSGKWDEDVLLSEAFYDWVDQDGYLSVHKAILNWKPLIMVANGDIRFDDKAEAEISLNTASLALIETLDKLNENGFISNKGAFVVKLLLNNKAVQQNPSDKYKTVVSPLKISKDGVVLENIKIR